MNDQSRTWVQSAPGEPVLKGVNWGGLRTLYIKEVRRFFKVQMQTVWAPAITTLLYLAIFTVALGRAGRTVMGVPFAVALGLLVLRARSETYRGATSTGPEESLPRWPWLSPSHGPAKRLQLAARTRSTGIGAGWSVAAV